VSTMPEHSSFVSREQLTEAYLKAIRLIDERVAPLLGKATTRVLVQGAAKRIQDSYPFLGFLVSKPYTEVVPALLKEQLAGISEIEVTEGLNALLDECFAGLRELTGDLIAPPLHDEVAHQLRQLH
jgi:hypothetical protein